MINPPHNSKKKAKLNVSKSALELPHIDGRPVSGTNQKVSLHKLLNIDSVLPAPKDVLTGKHGKQRLIKEKYKHLSHKKQVYKTEGSQEVGYEPNSAEIRDRVEKKVRAEQAQVAGEAGGVDKFFPKGSLRDRSLKQPSRGPAKSPQGLFTVEELKMLKNNREHLAREEEEERYAKKGFKIKKVKMFKDYELARMREEHQHALPPIVPDEYRPDIARLEAAYVEDQLQKQMRDGQAPEIEDAYRQLAIPDGSRNAGPAFGNQLLGTALQLPGPDYNALCTQHREDQAEGLLRGSRSAYPASPKQGSLPLSAASFPAKARAAPSSQLAGPMSREVVAHVAAADGDPRGVTASYLRPKLKRFNSLNEVRLDSQGSRPLDPDIFVAQKRLDIETANYQTRRAIERLGDSSRESAAMGQDASLPAGERPSKQQQVKQLLEEIERENTVRKMKEQDLKTAQLLRLINSMTAEQAEEDAADSAREIARAKGEIMQIIDQIQSKDTLTNLAQQLLYENGARTTGRTMTQDGSSDQDRHMPLIVKPPPHKSRLSPGRDKGREYQMNQQRTQDEKIMALIQEFTEREKLGEPNRENMTQSRRLLTFLQKNLLFEQNRLGEPVKDGKAQIEEEIERDLQYLNVFVQPIQNINIFNKDGGQEQEQKKFEVRKREAPEEPEAPEPTEALPFDEQLKDLILNSPLRPLVDARILELQRQVETKDVSAAKTAFANTFQQQSKLNQGPIAASQAPCQTPAYLQMQALSEVLDSVLMCEPDARGGDAAKAAPGAGIGGPLRDEKMLNPVQLEELRKMKQMKQEIAEQFLPQLLPFATGADGSEDAGKGPQDALGRSYGTSKKKTRTSTSSREHPARNGIDIGQAMLDDAKIVFEMERIHELQGKLEGLVAGESKGENEGRLKKDDVMTFLTEQYPPDKVLTKEERNMTHAGLRALLWPKDQHHLRPTQRAAIDAAQQGTAEERQKADLEELTVTEYHLGRRQQLDAILEKIDKSQVAVQKAAEVYTISGSQKQTLLYLSFIECARQVAQHSKKHAMLMVQVFHEYFSMTQKGIRGLVTDLHHHLKDTAQQTEKLVAAVQREYHNHLSKDIDCARLKQDFNKTIEVLDVAVRRLYVEEARRLSSELKLDLFGSNLGLVFPHASDYLLEKNLAKEEEEEDGEQPEDQKTGGAQSMALVRVAEAGAAKDASRGSQEGPTFGGEPGEEPVAGNVRLEIVSKAASWNEQVIRFRRRIVKHYRIAGYRQEVDDALDNRARPADAGGEERQVAQGRAGRMEKMGHGRSWGKPPGGYQAPGAVSYAEQQAATDEIYKLILADIDRLLAVVPMKTELEKRLDRQKEEYKQLARQCAQLGKAQDRHEKELQFLQARCGELTQEIVDQQAAHVGEVNRLQKERQDAVARAEDAAKEAAMRELQVPKEDAETMTVVDGEAERILRQREFNQRLLQYRAANRHYKEKAPPTTKQHEEQFTRGAPPVEHCYLPIAAMIRQIRQGKSKYQAADLKSVKNVLKMVAGLLQAKITAMGKHADKDHLAMMNIDSFYYHHIQQTYGLDQLANKYCEIYLASIEAHRSKDTRLELFRKFVGLDIEKLPYSIFERYVTMIKATNIPVQNLFTMALNGVYVEYPRVRYVFKELLSEASDLIHKQVYQQLQSYSKVVSGNPTLGKYLELEEYEVFRDLQDQTIRSRFKTNAMMLKSLFVELNIQTEELDSDSEDERGSSQAPKLVTKRQFVEFLLSNFDLTDYSRGNFNCSPKKTVQRVEAMVDKLFILAQGAVGDAMTPRQMMSAFREKIEVKLPVAAFFHIGINACALHENDENQHFEQVYQFYTQCDVEWDEGTQELVARNVHLRLNMAGMSFDQFMLFLNDTNCPLIADGKRQPAFEIFKTTCESKNRAALLCEDFLEAIRKYRLLPTVDACERAMHDREILIAKELRIQMLMLSEPVPAFVAETAARKLSAEIERKSTQPQRTPWEEDRQDAVEALKREQADIQKRTVKRRDEVKQEHVERQALEKVQGLAKLSELTGAADRKQYKSEVLAEFQGKVGGDGGPPKSEQSQQSATRIKSPHSSESLFDQPGSVVKDGRVPSGGARASMERSPGDEKPPPNARYHGGGPSAGSGSGGSDGPAGDSKSRKTRGGLPKSNAKYQQDLKDELAGGEPQLTSIQVAAPLGGGYDGTPDADDLGSHQLGSGGSPASPQGQRRTVLIKAEAKKSGTSVSDPPIFDVTGGQVKESGDRSGKSTEQPGSRAQAAPSSPGKDGPKAAKARLDRSPSEDEEEYGSEY